MQQLTRRSLLHHGSLWLGALAVHESLALPLSEAVRLFAAEPDASSAPAVEPLLRFGLITDLHYADKPATGTRHYRDSLDKLAAAAKQFGEQQPRFLVELGDLVDAAATVEAELAYLKRIDETFAAISPDRHYVLGNHCVMTLSKPEFLSGVGRKESYYSFDVSGFHFVVLDACFLGDGQPYHRQNFSWDDANIPPVEIDWLRADLKQTDKPTIVFAHQRLDNAKQHAIKNAAAVRSVLEESHKVLAAFQGHSHQNDHQEIAGIHYCTLRAMVEGAGVENNAFTQIDILPGQTLRVTGFQKQNSYDWRP